LRSILANVASNEVRRYRGTPQRDIDLERSIDDSIEDSSCRLRRDLLASGASPSAPPARRRRSSSRALWRGCRRTTAT